jgi:hypothetical protein
VPTCRHARRDHLLAGPHGWIDITLHAPQAPLAKDARTCNVRFSVNGETLLGESADLAQADAAHNPIGYRFVAPAGSLNAQLVLDSCLDKPVTLALPVTLPPDQLALLEFDGKALTVKGTQAYEPTSLDWVRGEMLKLRDGATATDGTLSTLTRLAIASVVLNVIVILVALRRRRRRG